MNEKKDQSEPNSSDYIKKMNEIISNIEVSISEWLAHGVTPTVIIGNHRSFDMIMEHLKLNPNEMNWREPVYIGFAEGNIKLRVLRTMDLTTGELMVKL